MIKNFRKALLLSALLSAGVAGAQESYFHLAPYTIHPAEVQPGRPLVLSEHEAQAYSGVVMNMSKDNVGDGWLIPLGGSFGLLPRLELGLHSTLLADDFAFPVKAYNIVNQFQVYGRYVILEQHLAAELTIDVPTVSASRFGLTLNVPGRYFVGPLDVFGMLRLHYFNYASMTGGTAHDIMAGLDLTAVYTIVDNFFIGLDAGFNYHAADGSADDMIVPLGVGVGYRLFSHSFIKLFFSFPDFASKDSSDKFNGFDNRVLHLQWVQAFDLSYRCREKTVKASVPPLAPTPQAEPAPAPAPVPDNPAPAPVPDNQE